MAELGSYLSSLPIITLLKYFTNGLYGKNKTRKTRYAVILNYNQDYSQEFESNQ